MLTLVDDASLLEVSVDLKDGAFLSEDRGALTAFMYDDVLDWLSLLNVLLNPLLLPPCWIPTRGEDGLD